MSTIACLASYRKPFSCSASYKHMKHGKGKVLVGKGLAVQVPIYEIEVDDED